MRLSSQPSLVSKKKAVAMFFLLGGFMATQLGNGAASAQDLSKAALLSDQNLNLSLEPRDPSCRKPSPIGVNKLFCLSVTVKGANEAWLKGLLVSKFDAVMPGHHHGMVTRPKITNQKPGSYLIEGVKLHMSGDWSLELKLEHGQVSTQVAIPLKL
jgi:hypothetical protein